MDVGAHYTFAIIMLKWIGQWGDTRYWIHVPVTFYRKIHKTLLLLVDDECDAWMVPVPPRRARQGIYGHSGDEFTLPSSLPLPSLQP